jgi:hypothetical protein
MHRDGVRAHNCQATGYDPTDSKGDRANYVGHAREFFLTVKGFVCRRGHNLGGLSFEI